MPERLLFLTGKLAEKSLHKVLESIKANPKIPKFDYRIEQMGVSVAALMTPALISRRLKDAGDASKIILPGLCQGDISVLASQYGVPVEKGPEDLKDLPQYFGQTGQTPDLSEHNVTIFAEIVDAPFMRVEAIVEKAKHFIQQGANVIDLGCLPGQPFLHLAESIKTLKSLGIKVSVDSLQPEDLLLAGETGADYLLSLNEKTLWIADEVPSIPVLIPQRPGHMASLRRAIRHCLAKGKAFIADPILDPIHFGFTDSLVRYAKLRKQFPNIPMMMGVGNLTELTDADTTGINAMLFGIISELNINAVLATSVSPHAVNAIAEADIARRMMFRAKQDNRLPRGYTNGLLGLHERKPFSYTPEEIEEFAKQIKDPSFRIMVSEQGVHVFNRDGMQTALDPFDFYQGLDVDNDASHAFYLGVELAKAQMAWQLNKRYVQDEKLNWGVNTRELQEKETSHRMASIKEKQAQKK